MNSPQNKIGTPLANLKWELFAWEYLKDMNQGNAAIRAGYKPAGAHVIGCNLLKKAKIRDRVQEIIAERSAEAGVTDTWVITKLKQVVERCMQPEPVMVWDHTLGQLIQKKNDDGDFVFEFDSNGANKALELLGRYLGLFEKDNSQKQNVITVNIVGQQQNYLQINNAGNDNAAAGDGEHTDRGVLTMLPSSAAI